MPSSLYERFLQPSQARCPSVDGWLAPVAGREGQPTAAASLEAVALLAAQAPPGVEVNLYERFLQTSQARGPSVDGWLAPAAGRRGQPTAAASLEAVALLAAQAPPDVEVTVRADISFHAATSVSMLLVSSAGTQGQHSA